MECLIFGYADSSDFRLFTDLCAVCLHVRWQSLKNELLNLI
jgi:hypothetical protein